MVIFLLIFKKVPKAQNNYFLFSSSPSFLNGLSPRILTRSSLKITSFSRSLLASSDSLLLFFLRISHALLYCFSIISDISWSIFFAVSSEYGLVKL